MSTDASESRCNVGVEVQHYAQIWGVHKSLLNDMKCDVETPSVAVSQIYHHHIEWLSADGPRLTTPAVDGDFFRQQVCL